MENKPEGDSCEDNVMEESEGFCLLDPLMSDGGRLMTSSVTEKSIFV